MISCFSLLLTSLVRRLIASVLFTYPCPWHTELNIFILNAWLKCFEYRVFQNEALPAMMVFSSIAVSIFLQKMLQCIISSREWKDSFYLFILVLFETGFFFVAQAGFKLMILLPLPPEDWDCICVLFHSFPPLMIYSPFSEYISSVHPVIRWWIFGSFPLLSIVDNSAVSSGVCISDSFLWIFWVTCASLNFGVTCTSFEHHQSENPKFDNALKSEFFWALMCNPKSWLSCCLRCCH